MNSHSPIGEYIGLFSNILHEAIIVYDSHGKFLTYLNPAEEIAVREYSLSVYIPSVNLKIKDNVNEKYFYSFAYYDDYRRPQLLTFQRIQNCHKIPFDVNTGMLVPQHANTVEMLRRKMKLLNSLNAQQKLASNLLLSDSQTGQN